ncbi:putative mitochondrial 3-oxoacyl-(acyl-carrier protein) reductase [Leptomonas pyrrhocoris]|uniref:Putative mitochondrial 3-oxoacyl-(Acyl-carrier protein) reductase n=1 Tax=Leptomonas pyrrhocoris TaxID=157538 RepID=A0A0M9FZG7_LEPPY|nr:putative mitochondrial 3-oxoacyl-(acyl-carrier protein) reductase [Leptomonas pyrrhocoris]XP_015657749.1 putative mitochondrial 3-oxoacyl-(acyl-carrier protein) reductase [Leptomonas pyrrhocoris]KPA79309.1 putative mitochondrial 3-oxoacyl-(acyl-carrier protein) reductase [Leptomonas pyrrhocoris]KPA79310.1 putative mitochondrial 3-oxoacyl-(acyl-carrier protein) reductase [Leptomonas pyrrhocoris]|eukprot:XP_015657748.1 putative mitochondrial 3-oxoacyl-(acyl-carrier protein) reductase [Leptomonas pyrrhocoris]
MQGKFIQSITGRPIIVTGGSSGLGAATARFLAQQGAKVTLLDRNAEEGEKVAKEIGGHFVATDVCSEADVQRAIAAAQDVCGKPLFGAVNCAGICPAAKVVGKKGCHPLDLFNRTLQVNLLGTFNVCRLAAEAMQKNTEALEAEADRGVIVNTASVAAYEGQVGQAAYAASKGGIVSLTLPLAREFASHRIRVNTICPGIMQTPLLPPAVGDALGATVPYPSRLGNPDEFAHLVYFLFSNRYMNGECIRLDGATRMAAK